MKKLIRDLLSSIVNWAEPKEPCKEIESIEEEAEATIAIELTFESSQQAESEISFINTHMPSLLKVYMLELHLPDNRYSIHQESNVVILGIALSKIHKDSSSSNSELLPEHESDFIDHLRALLDLKPEKMTAICSYRDYTNSVVLPCKRGEWHEMTPRTSQL